ncbi:MAG: phosphodiester glycosidase family protein [Ruminococcus sp.]|nr:phosphodiester glycosidase family protein [Ruminococcus sp.]
MKKFLAITLAVLMLVSVLPMSAFAASFDTSVSNDYFSVISKKEYNLAPGATETELVLNSAAGDDRKVAHIFEVDTKNDQIQVLPGYYGIENLDPDNLALDGVADKSVYWKSEQLTKTVAYYEGLGYNVVGAMNTALAYDSNAPYGYMVYNGVVLGTPEVHKGAQTYLAIDAEGNCELRLMSTPLDGSEVTAISANFGWLVKDGVLVSKSVERTTSDASRSMIGIKADGTLVFCQVDGRNAPFSTGLSNYEMGEMMLSIGCVNAVNCDGGGSSTFVSKREGEEANVMRSVPSDGSERPTINSVILVSKAVSTGEFDHAVLTTDYEYYAPGTKATMTIKGVDAAGSPAEVPAEGISWQLSDSSFGTVVDGVFTSNGTKGDVTVQMLYNGNVVGEKTISIVDPDVFALAVDETVLPYGKSMALEFACTYGADDWDVCVDGAYTVALSDDTAATMDGNTLTATTDESVKGVTVTVTYKPNTAVKDTLLVTYGKGSEVIYDFEDGTTAGFVGFDEAKQWCIDNGVNNTLVGSDPLGGQFNEQVDGYTAVSDASKGEPVRNGNHALAWKIDNTNATFGNWTYNVIFNVGETIVLRDVANGKNATTLGMWLYIPEGAAGLAFQSQLYTKSGDSYTHCQSHFTFKTKSGTVKNLNSCTEADIPESRWVYASISLTAYDYVCTPIASFEGNARTPSFIRTYIKPTVPAVHTFYIDDITLDYSSAVDDRIAPDISNVSYTTADESVALADGATINGNTIAFSATVSDNTKLDYSTGKIYVDGNELTNVTCSGKTLASEGVTLTSGAHEVAFEVKDALGNPTKVVRNITVAGDSVVTLSGHNDSGKLPEIDSVYFVDINTNVADVNKLTTVLKLQTANNWETQGAVVADGFDAKFEYSEMTNLLTVTVERNGEAVDETATTLVSIPVRLWSWNTYNHVTGEVVTPDAQFATGYCPIVTVDCDVVQGSVEYVKNVNAGYLGAFGGSISVTTNINDNVNPWHKHTATAVEDKAATCTEDGYTGRTYCEVCSSIVDYGTVVEAKGHNHKVDIQNAQIACECGDTIKSTGIIEVEGKSYYAINGKLVNGWQFIETDWYYFDSKTYASVSTYNNGVVTYEFEEDGKLKSGVWHKTSRGNRYYYGPSYYKATQADLKVEIDGNTYYFGKDGYCFTGNKFVLLSNQAHFQWYQFDENGVLLGEWDYTGLAKQNGYTYCVVDGVSGLGMFYMDGAYYYTAAANYFAAVTNIERNCYVTNCLLPVDDYRFGADGRMLDNTVCCVDNVLYYYVLGKVSQGTGTVTINGEEWSIDENGKVDFTGTMTDASGQTLDYVNGEHKYIPKNGVVGDYFYVNDVVQKAYQLVEFEGNYYFINDYNKIARNGKLYLNDKFVAGHTYPNGDPMKPGLYEFDKDGKMVILNGVVGEYYYVNGIVQKAWQLVEFEGDYYFINDYNKLARNGKLYLSEKYVSGFTYPNGDPMQPGLYEFDKDGKMVILNGVVGEYYYVNGVVQKAWQLIEFEGDYYFINDYNKLARNGKLYLSEKFVAGHTYPNGDPMQPGLYEFDKDGKMIILNGVVGDYYYVNGVVQKAWKLIEFEGNFYFINDYNKLAKNGKLYLGENFVKGFTDANGNPLKPGLYEFAADGKMILN